MRRYLFAVTIAAAAACFDVSSPLPPALILSPVLDSLFVGDSLAPRAFAYYNTDGQRANPGPLTWTIGPNSVATINPTTGVIHGVGKGVATVTATGGQATGIALVAVSRPLDLTLLLDTIVLMQQDTFTIPVAVQKKDVAATDTVTFDVDSIGPAEASSSRAGRLDPVCNPPRPWAFWRSAHNVAPLYFIVAYSHGTPADSVAGSITITQFAQAAAGGAIISGRYRFITQRTDLYTDPLGVETMRGTFVVPLLTRQGFCQG